MRAVLAPCKKLAPEASDTACRAAASSNANEEVSPKRRACSERLRLGLCSSVASHRVCTTERQSVLRLASV